MRARFQRLSGNPRARLQRKLPNLVFGDHSADGLTIESVCAVKSPTRVIFHFHGGVLFMGSPASYRKQAKRLSYRFDAEVFVPAYRLAPEHPYPVTLDDALAAGRFVSDPRKDVAIFVAGDSAGGGLSLSRLVRLRDLRQNIPKAALLLSPWADLTVSGRSVEGNRRKDLWSTRKHLEQGASY
jgi:acetyl esterase/lipase